MVEGALPTARPRPLSPPRRPGSLRRPGNGQGHARALARARFQLDLATVGLDKLPGERQGKAKRRLPARGGADAVEAGEDLLLVLGCDARPVVADGNVHAILVALG